MLELVIALFLPTLSVLTLLGLGAWTAARLARRLHRKTRQ